MSSDFVKKTIAALQSLQGQTLVKAEMLEMALIEANVNEQPVFEHQSCPFLQADILFLIMADGETKQIRTYQNDYMCDFGVSEGAEQLDLVRKKTKFSPIFRHRVITDFPAGKIQEVSIKRNVYGDVSEIVLFINGQSVLLKAGEVYEQHDGTLKFFGDDECVLIFLDSNKRQNVHFEN